MPSSQEQGAGAAAGGAVERNVWDGRGTPLLPYCVFGLPFHALDFNAVVQALRAAMRIKRPVFLSTPNVNFLVACQSDPDFRDSVILSDLSVPDGMPIVWMAKLLGIPIHQRVAGANLFEALYKASVAKPEEQLSVYFFGGPDGAAQAASDKLNLYPAPAGAFPALRCAGYAAPGFGSIEDMSTPAIVDHINAAKPDFLLVALGARKGQSWILHNQRRLTATVISHLGAVVNFVAGSIKRAPVFYQRIGMEWLWRIKQEPGLWQRYAKDALLLLGLLVLRGVPQVLLEKILGAARAKAPEAAVFKIYESSTSVEVRLTGVWVSSNRYRLWSALQGMAAHDVDVHIDMSEVEFVDCAFLGLLLHMRGNKLHQMRQLTVTGLSPALRLIFYFSCVDYLVSKP